MRPIKVEPNELPLENLEYLTLCAKLKQLMVAQELTEKDLSIKIFGTDSNHANLNRLLNGKIKNPTIGSLSTVASALGFKIVFSIQQDIKLIKEKKKTAKKVGK